MTRLLPWTVDEQTFEHLLSNGSRRIAFFRPGLIALTDGNNLSALAMRIRYFTEG
jgi:hypothetical protein